jgi:hypothetical protein
VIFFFFYLHFFFVFCFFWSFPTIFYRCLLILRWLLLPLACRQVVLLW